MQVLAIATAHSGVSADQLSGLTRAEEANSWRLYARGILRQFYGRNPTQDALGAVFIFEVSDLSEARALVSEFPMVRAGLLRADLLELTPFRSFEALFASDVMGAPQ